MKKFFSVQRDEETANHESEKEFKERVRSHHIIFFTQFELVFSFMAVLPSFWPYLNKIDPTADKYILGLNFAASGLGQVLVSILLGKLSNKLNSNREIIKYLLIIKIISHLVYANLELIPTPSHRRYWYLFSRLIAGISTACTSLTRSYVVTSTTFSERRKGLSILTLYTTLAHFLGPLLQYIFIGLGENGFWLFNFLKIDMYTTPNWILIIITIINLFLLTPKMFKEFNMLKKKQAVIKNEKYFSETNYKYLAWSLIILNFIFIASFMFMSVLATPMAMDEFAMTRKEAVNLNSILKTCCAILSFGTILTLNPICRKFGEMRIFIISVFMIFIARCFYYPFNSEPHITYDNLNSTCLDCVGCPLKQTWCQNDEKVYMHLFIIAHIIETIASSWTQVLVLTVFSKVLGSKQQGTWMGIMTSSGSISRIISPVLLIFIYTSYGPKITTISMNTIYAIIVGTLFVIIFYIMNNNKSNENIEAEELKLTKNHCFEDEATKKHLNQEENKLNNKIILENESSNGNILKEGEKNGNENNHKK